MTSNVLINTTDSEHLQSLTNLMPSNPGQTKYYCGRCEGWYLDEETLIEHINLYHEYWCTACRVRLRSENQLSQHMLNVHFPSNQCNSCRVCFNGSTDIALHHMLTKHSEIRDKHSYLNNHRVERREPVAPVPPQQPPSNPKPTNNVRYTKPKRNSEYLCAKCNLKFTNIHETARHMKIRHNVEIGIRKFPDTGKEEIFIINNKGKIYTVSAQQHKERMLNKEVTFDGGQTSLTITNTEQSVQPRPPLPPPTISISQNVTAPAFRPSSSNNVTQNQLQITRTPIIQGHATSRATTNHVNTSISSVQNGFTPNYASTPETVHKKTTNNQNNNSKQKLCIYCNKYLSSNFSLNRHMKALHKEVYQQSQPTLRIDRILPQSEIEPFEPHNVSVAEETPPIQSPPSQVLSNTSDTDSIPSVHVEIETDGELEIVNDDPAANEPPITIDDNEEQEVVEAVESDSDMEMIVISEPEPRVPKPKPFVRVLPSQRFLRKMANKNNPSQRVNKQEIAEKLKKINSQLRLRNKIMSPR